MGQRQQSASAPDSRLPSPSPSRSDRSQHFCLGVCAPCVPGSLLSLPLSIAGGSLPDDVAGRLSEDVASPTPLSSMDLCCHWFLICCLPRVLVACLLRPLEPEECALTAVDENLEFRGCCLNCSPRFRSIEEY